MCFSWPLVVAAAFVEQEQYLQATLDTVVSNFGGNDIIKAVCTHTEKDGTR